MHEGPVLLHNPAPAKLEHHEPVDKKKELVRTTTYLAFAIGALLVPLLLLCVTCKRASNGSGVKIDPKRAQNYQEFDKEEED